MTDSYFRNTRPRFNLTLWVAVIAGVIVVGAGGLMLIGALFTSQATVSGQSVETGTVQISADTQATSAPISTEGLLPGDETTTEILIENTGTADVFYAIRLPELADAGAVDRDLADALQVTVITEDGVEQRSLTEWQAGTVQVATPLDAGGDVPIIVSVELPLSADNSLQGLKAAFSVQIDAIQARNVAAPIAGWVTD